MLAQVIDARRDLRATYLREALPGRIFFAEYLGLAGRINQWYQGRRRGGRPAGFAPTHVGVIGYNRDVFESTMFAGPTVGRLDNYLVPRYRLAIGRITPAHSNRDVNRALGATERYLDEYEGRYGYDWVSLLTLGILQKNNAEICSELVAHYVNELLRHNNDWELVGDRFVLPWDWLGATEITWRSWISA